VARLTEAEQAFLRDNPFVGVVTTLRPDGSPHATVVWVDADHEGPWFNTAYGRAKTRYLAGDPRVALTVIDPSDPYRWISVSGAAGLVDEGADPDIDHLAHKYLGVDEYPNRRPGEQRVTVRIEPRLIDSRGLD
jgi:PPOX class probable F420-dependent enzyme